MQHLSKQTGQALQLEAVQECYDRLTGLAYNLNAYTTIEDATDVDDLIHVGLSQPP